MSDARLFPSEAEFTDFYASLVGPVSPSRLPAIAAFCNQWAGLKETIEGLDKWPGSRESLTQRLQLALIAGMQIGFTEGKR